MTRDSALPRRRLLDIDLDMVVMAMNNAEGGYFEPDTGEATLIVDGEVLGVEDFDEDETTWVAVPRDDSHLAFRDMTDFAASVTDSRVAERLAFALEGTKAFRRFRDAIERYERYRYLWLGFRDARREARAIQWLLDEDLVEETDALTAIDALRDRADALLTDARGR